MQIDQTEQILQAASRARGEASVVAGNHASDEDRFAFRQQTLVFFERTIGLPDYLPAQWLLDGANAAHATARVVVNIGGQLAGHGSGFCVSRRLFVTNHHVLQSPSIAASSIAEFGYRVRGGEVSPPIQRMFSPETFFATEPHLDVTVVALAQDWGHRVPLIAESGKAIEGDYLNIVQHPNAEPQKIAIRNNQMTRLVGDFIHYTTDTEPGSSGSGVFNDQWQLAAVHHAGVPFTNESGDVLLRDGTVWDGSRSKIDKIDWIANEAVRVSSIVAWLQNHADLGPLQRAMLPEAIARR